MGPGRRFWGLELGAALTGEAVESVQTAAPVKGAEMPRDTETDSRAGGGGWRR